MENGNEILDRTVPGTVPIKVWVTSMARAFVYDWIRKTGCLKVRQVTMTIERGYVKLSIPYYCSVNQKQEQKRLYRHRLSAAILCPLEGGLREVEHRHQVAYTDGEYPDDRPHQVMEVSNYLNALNRGAGNVFKDDQRWVAQVSIEGTVFKVQVIGNNAEEIAKKEKKKLRLYSRIKVSI